MTSPIRIGLLVAEQGPAGLWGPSARTCATLAASEINQAGGLLGMLIDIVPIDVGPSARSAATATRRAIEEEGVAAMIGMFPSYARNAVKQAIGDRPFIYTPQFEGLERDSNIVTTGETSLELLAPAIDWLLRHKHTRRFFLCGSDYIWPRASFAIARRLIGEAGGIVTGEYYLPLQHHDYETLFEAIREAKADVVMPNFLGMDAVQFNRRFAQAGFASRMLRLAPAIDETVIYNLSEDATENLFIASGYYASLKSHNNDAFLQRYHEHFGASPPPANAYGQSCYEGLHCLSALAHTANSLDPRQMLKALGRAEQQRTARGQNPSPIVGARPPIHFARVDGLEVKVIAAY